MEERAGAIIKAVAAEIGLMIYNREIKRATKYLSKTLTVKATVHGKRRRNEPATFVVSVGRPNYAESKFIKSAMRAGEPFPVKRIQLKFVKTAKKKA